MPNSLLPQLSCSFTVAPARVHTLHNTATRKSTAFEDQTTVQGVPCLLYLCTLHITPQQNFTLSAEQARQYWSPIIYTENHPISGVN